MNPQDASAASLFSAADLLRLEAAGISREAAARQAGLLRTPPSRPHLLRACALGDGIEALPERIDALAEEFQRASVEGRIVHFIPASGAATRMAESFESLRRQGTIPEPLAALFHGQEMDLAELPKALVPFHRYGDRVSTPMEEHLREAAALAGQKAAARVHFTISPEHEARFRAHLEKTLAMLRAEGLALEAGISLQDPATQTLALDASGLPFREANGDLLIRPGGHGSLLRNLEACGAEFAWLRNIDNIACAPRRAEGRKIRRAMAATLIHWAREPRDRPLRVCGVVRNTGEPGGSPFWVSGSGEEQSRIVEPFEVNPEDADQQRIFRSAAHFNPVDMVCALRDSQGRPFPLAAFTEAGAAVVRKTHQGRALSALEWPGLWNGGMALWKSRCVEIPLSQFAPVKTALDLLRPEHLG